jgi:tRNA U34 5-methylaminomethyl-2-thiouridine-forming methyltransferase MnmC
MNEIFETEDGSKSLKSINFGVSYHSKHGAIQETRHVFIDAGLDFCKQGHIDLLDIGFGTGLNALMALQWAQLNQVKVNYVGIEAYPIHLDTALLMNYPQALDTDDKLDSVFIAMHEVESGVTLELDQYFSFEKRISKFETLEDKNAYDVIFFDAFAPNAQPDLWELDLLQRMYDALKASGVLTTYCAKGQVKRNLKALGFTVEALPGPPGKREMTRAIKS